MKKKESLNSEYEYSPNASLLSPKHKYNAPYPCAITASFSDVRFRHVVCLAGLVALMASAPTLYVLFNQIQFTSYIRRLYLD